MEVLRIGGERRPGRVKGRKRNYATTRAVERFFIKIRVSISLTQQPRNT